jgi:hypothetical protein
MKMLQKVSKNVMAHLIYDGLSDGLFENTYLAIFL